MRPQARRVKAGHRVGSFGVSAGTRFRARNIATNDEQFSLCEEPSDTHVLSRTRQILQLGLLSSRQKTITTTRQTTPRTGQPSSKSQQPRKKGNKCRCKKAAQQRVWVGMIGGLTKVIRTKTSPPIQKQAAEWQHVLLVDCMWSLRNVPRTTIIISCCACAYHSRSVCVCVWFVFAEP